VRLLDVRWLYLVQIRHAVLISHLGAGQGVGDRVWVVGFGGQGAGFGDFGPGFMSQGLGFRIQDSGLMSQHMGQDSQ